MTILTVLVTAVAALGFFSISPALAQDAPRVRAIRVTTGQVQISGWEKQFIDRDPNLAHFNWIPMTQSLQGIRTISGPAAGPVSPSTGKTTSSAYVHSPTAVPASPRYVKPVHVPTVVERAPEYVTPVHVPTVVPAQPAYTPPVHISEASKQNSITHVNAVLHRAPLKDGERAPSAQAIAAKETDEQVAGKLVTTPGIATYPAASGTFRQATRVGGLLETKNVYGKITHVNR